jgi:superfamily II DNA/RNA helicase
MDYGKEQDSIEKVEFYPVSIGVHNCNVNRKTDEDLHLIHNFSDASPEYSNEYGPHLKLYQKNTTKPDIIPLNSHIASAMLIKDGKNMSDEKYFSTFVAKKKEFVEESLIKKTFAKGFDFPNPVQALCIPELIQRKDVLVQFKSGTGKTHGFLFGCLWAFDPADKELQFVFMTSSHEVAIQIYNQASFLLPEGTNISLCIGQKKDNNAASGDFKTGFGQKTAIGTSSLINKPKTPKEEREEIMRAQVIVCTMGKFYDYFINRKWINTEFVKTLCVDEFDNIVASSSRPRSSTIISTTEQMAAIIRRIPETTQRAFFSATVSHEALEIAHSYFRKYDPKVGEPFIVLLDIDDYTLEGIRQYYVPCTTYNEKKDVLLDLIKQCRIAQGIVFTNRTDTAEDIKKFLDEQTVPISSSVFHGSLAESVRTQIHKEFLENKIRLLISTDVLARGFDVQGINVVINFDMPNDFEVYVHRIGRSGRHGRKGVAISFVLVNGKIDETIKLKTINERSKKSPIEQLTKNLENLL